MADETQPSSEVERSFRGGTVDWRPVPDPTEMTTRAVTLATEQSRREMAGLRELLETRLQAMDRATELLAATVGKVPSDTDKQINALRELLGARIDGMDQATRLLAGNLSDLPGDIERAIQAMQEILRAEIRNVQDVALEKFAAIEGTFASNALALTAALAAQKEAAAEQNKSNTLAISKSEQATKETILANAAQNASQVASQAATIGDLKERVVRLETAGPVRLEERLETRASRGGNMATLMAVIAGVSVIAVIVLGLVAAFKK